LESCLWLIAYSGGGGLEIREGLCGTDKKLAHWHRMVVGTVPSIRSAIYSHVHCIAENASWTEDTPVVQCRTGTFTGVRLCVAWYESYIHANINL